MRPWNLCLTHDPSLAGLYRAINDFSSGLGGSILSFDDGRVDRTLLSQTDGALRIRCGGPAIFRDCHLLAPAASRKAEAVLRDARLVVVHSLFRAHVDWARGWAHRHDKPYWIVPHGCLDPWGLRRRAALKRLWLTMAGRRCLADARYVVFSSHREFDKARRRLSTDNGVVIHWPVDVPDLADRPNRRIRFRARHRIPTAARLFLFVGRLHTMKRPIETMQAFAAAGQADAHLFIGGMDGNLSRAQVQAAVPAGVLGRVHVAGELKGAELGDAMMAADAFISLSRRENFGYAVCDALAHGLPVILTRGHDLVHELPTMRDGSLACGWRLDDDAVASAAYAIADLCARESEQLADMGAEGRCWVGSHLSRAGFHRTLSTLAN